MKNKHLPQSKFQFYERNLQDTALIKSQIGENFEKETAFQHFLILQKSDNIQKQLLLKIFK